MNLGKLGIRGLGDFCENLSESHDELKSEKNISRMNVGELVESMIHTIIVYNDSMAKSINSNIPSKLIYDEIRPEIASAYIANMDLLKKEINSKIEKILYKK